MKSPENSPINKHARAKLDSAGQVSKAKVWIVLRRAYHSLVGFLESGITSRGVALSDFVVLEVLLHKGELTAGEIAKKTHLAAASVEITIANLRELTERGRGLIEWLYEGHEKDIASVFNVLSNQQQFDLYQSLRRVGHNAAGRRAVPTTSQKGGLTPWQLSRAVEYIRRHAARPITIREVAASIELSESHFRRAFKIATGLPPHRWMLSVRICEAQKLLKESVTVGDCHRDRVCRSKPFFESISKDCRRFPTSVAAGSQSAIDCDPASVRLPLNRTR